MRHATLRLLFLTFTMTAILTGASHGEETPPENSADVAVERVERGPLVLEQIPEIPARIFDGLRRYQSTRSANFHGWHAGGEGILISTRFGQTEQIHWVHEPGGSRRQLTFFAEPVTTASPRPVADDTGFLFPRDVGGSESYEVFYYSLGSGEIRQLSRGGRNGAPVWSPDGSRFAYFSTARNGRDWDILVSTPTGETKTVYEAQGAWIPAAFTNDGRHLVLTRLVSIRENHIHLLDLDSGELTPLLEASDEGRTTVSGNFHFSPDSRWLYFTSDRDGDFRQLYRKDLESNELTALTDSLAWDIEDVDLSPDGRHLAFSLNVDGASQLKLMQVDGWQERALPALPDGRVRSLNFSPDGRQIGFEIETPRLAGDVFSIKLSDSEDAGELIRWTYSETAGLPEQHFVEPTLIRYPTFDEQHGQPRQIPAIYYAPEGDGPHPVIVRIHGGPEGQSRPGFDSNLQYWVHELGAAVILPNVRGSTGYGREYIQLDDGFKREDSVKDIGALLDWIEAQPELDAERVAVYGGSYGGYMVLASMIHFNDRLRAGVDVVGISNFVTFLTNTKDYRRDLRRVEYGDERDPAMRAHFEKISPTARAGEIQKPLFIAQGLNDPRVPASESEQMVREIRESGGDVWYLLAKDEGHGFRKRANRDFFQAAVVLFFERHLLPIPP